AVFAKHQSADNEKCETSMSVDAQYFSRTNRPAFVEPLPLHGTPPADDASRRWDNTSVQAWTGTYGDYLTAKVSKVFPTLFATLR
ncbi:MAG: hypothetical protein ACKOBB_12465, partial [Acidimicrobiaceae bacterium]